VYNFYQYILRSASTVMIPQLSAAFDLAAIVTDTAVNTARQYQRRARGPEDISHD
jgi:hypothetical protein